MPPVDPDKAKIADLVQDFEPKLRAAFLDAINDIRSKAEIKRIAEALERGDVEAALEAVHLQPSAFQVFIDALAAAFGRGGITTIGRLPVLRAPSGGRTVIRFDGRNPRAEAWLRQHSSELVAAIVADQRVAIRAALVVGMQAGTNPRRTALDIVGRLNPSSQRREGGIVGLTAQQAQFVAAARAELASGDPAQMRAYLERVRRDRRFDRAVLAAIRDGKPLSQDLIAKIIGRYSDRLLQLRGETIARTETLASLHAAQDEAFRQAVDIGAVRPNQVRRVWRSAGDARVRDTHRAMNGDTVGLDETFASPSGARLRFPGDPTAPAAEVINCRCHLDMRIDFLANVR